MMAILSSAAYRFNRYLTIGEYHFKYAFCVRAVSFGFKRLLQLPRAVELVLIQTYHRMFMEATQTVEYFEVLQEGNYQQRALSIGIFVVHVDGNFLAILCKSFSTKSSYTDDFITSLFLRQSLSSANNSLTALDNINWKHFGGSSRLTIVAFVFLLSRGLSLS